MDNNNTIFDEKPDNDTLGGRIGRARDASGLSIQEMAVQLGVTDETWSNWEGDREEPRANRLAMLAGFLNVSPSWLLYGVGEAPFNPTQSELVKTLEDRLIAIELAHSATTETIRQLRDTLSYISTKQPGAPLEPKS